MLVQVCNLNLYAISQFSRLLKQKNSLKLIILSYDELLFVGFHCVLPSLQTIVGDSPNMIFDIDNKTSVLKTVETLTSDYFDIKVLYSNLKKNNITSYPDFWAANDHLLTVIADHLEQPLDTFTQQLVNNCLENSLRIIGYHCTRHRKQNIFKEQGILPLTSKIIENFLSEIEQVFHPFRLQDEQKRELIEIIKGTRIWVYRSGTGAGPYFLLSYVDAKDPQKDFHKNGSEFYWSLIDELTKYCRANDITLPYSDRSECRCKIAEELKPLIIRCAIPFNILDDKNYYISCMLTAYFNFFDPDKDSSFPFEGLSIDLKGTPLEAANILHIENI